MTELNEGSSAPDFDLPDDAGKTVRLSDLRGRPVVVFFYPRDDTSACTAEAIDFSTLQAQFDAQNAVLIGISPDTVQKHARFRTKHRLTPILLADPDHAAINAYGLWVQKKLYGVTYMGVERTTVLIAADGTIAKIWRKVRVKGHADAVLEALKQI